LMSVFTPAAFLPGLTGQMYAQFALVIAATALISAVNAVTLKPVQCATWLRRRPAAEERRNLIYRTFNRSYAAAERFYEKAIRRTVARSGLAVAVSGLIVVCAFFGLSRIPTGFLPLEDQGYFVVSVQLPDGASLERTQAAMQQVSSLAEKVPGVDQVLAISGASVLDNNASISNAGVAYVVLKDWSQRGRHQDL